MLQPHFLLVTFLAQGHINPTLQLAKRLIRIGAHVMFLTIVSAWCRMTKVSTAQGLSFLSFSNGYDDGLKPGDDQDHYASELRCRGKETMMDLIAMEVAREHPIPSVVLWIQPATIFDIYYFYFNGYEETIKGQAGLPPLASRDLPSFLTPPNPYPLLLALFKEQIEVLTEEPNAKILVNTFDALEPKALKAIEKWKKIHQRVPLKVIRNKNQNGKEGKEDTLSCKEELEQLGLIVLWCSQVEVLSHPSLGVLRDALRLELNFGELGYRSSGCGFPSMDRSRDECEVLGDGEIVNEARRNIEKWKDLAKEVAKEGGSLDRNLKAFVDDVAQD
ncbi:hypothetical protein DITRI_Ditri17bG0030000 [Diplodiscus trichospermus]